jgi:Fe-S-cluster containining protein
LAGWEELLGVQWPENACDQSGECCRGAAQLAPWKNLLPLAATGDATARDFLNQYVAYPSRETAQESAPYAVEASLQVAHAKGYRSAEIIFYHCRYLKGKNECQIYEDRPTLCRTFPESPFGAIPSCCGYYAEARRCLSQIESLRQELAVLKHQQALIELQSEEP